MSTTSYQTNVKPRSRASSHGEGSEKQTGSRASSSPSLRLSKTVSRALDEVSVPRNSRPSSPVVYIRRPRTHDPGRSESAMSSPRHSTSSMRSSRTMETIFDDGQPAKKDEVSKEKPIVINSAQSEGQQPGRLPKDLQGAAGVHSGDSVPAPLSSETDPRGGTSRPSPDVPRGRVSLRSPSSMQPTVVEEVEEIVATSPTTLPPQISVPGSADYTDAAHSSATTTSVPKDLAPVLPPAVLDSSSPQAISSPIAVASGAALQDSLVAPSPQAPVPFIHPAVIHSLPGANEAEIQVPVGLGSVRDTEGNAYQQGLSGVASPLASPPHSPMLYQHVGRPASQPAPYPYPYPYPLINNSPNQQPFYPAPFPFAQVPFGPPDTIFGPGFGGAEDERTKLLEKVSNVLPDINRLLHYYQETQGLLNQKDHLVKLNETQYEEAINKVKIELSATKEEYEKIIGEQVGENLNLKSTIKEQSEKISELEAMSQQADDTKEQLANLQASHQLLEQQMEHTRALNEELRDKQGTLEAQLESLQNQADSCEAEHDRKMTALKVAHENQLLEKEENHARLLNEHKASLSKIQLDLAGMITKHTQQKRDLESARSTISQQEDSLANNRQDLNNTLELHRSQLEAATKAMEERAEKHKNEVSLLSEKMANSIAKYEAKMEAIRASHQKEIDQLRDATDEERLELIISFEQREKELQTMLGASQESLRTLDGELDAKHEEHRQLESELAAERKAHDSLKNRHETATSHHLELANSMLSLRSKQAEWDREAERMDRILQSLGQVGSRRSKGDVDQFFIKAFEQLAQLVEELSKEYCSNSQVYPIVFQKQYADAGLPDPMGDTEAARSLRCLLAEKQVWNALHTIIFQPFLFGSACEAADECGLNGCLLNISKTIKRKSLRREAIWRAITMRAIYASEYGRKAAAVTATLASWAIIHKMRRLAPPELHSKLQQGVRVLVKTAVHIWRRVRLELGPVHSSMPAKDARSEEQSDTARPASDVILWVRPHIVGESLMVNLQPDAADGQEKTGPGSCCVYIQGIAPRQDSPVIVRRRKELMLMTQNKELS